jgi:hypothetical protein
MKWIDKNKRMPDNHPDFEDCTKVRMVTDGICWGYGRYDYDKKVWEYRFSDEVECLTGERNFISNKITHWAEVPELPILSPLRADKETPKSLYNLIKNNAELFRILSGRKNKRRKGKNIIKAKDLRLGNFIYTHNRVGNVLNLVNRVDNFRVGDKRREEAIDEIQTTICYLYPQKENMGCFLPIPITEKWLNDLGFKKENSENYIYETGQQGFIVNKSQDNEFTLLYRSDMGLGYTSLTFIRYIHELQNLFFALTKTELENKEI